MTRDVTFLHKSYFENCKVEKPVLVTMNYEGPNDEEKLETVPTISNNNNNVDSDSDSDTYLKNDNKNVFDKTSRTKMK